MKDMTGKQVGIGDKVIIANKHITGGLQFGLVVWVEENAALVGVPYQGYKSTVSQHIVVEFSQNIYVVPALSYTAPKTYPVHSNDEQVGRTYAAVSV
jgi:hypothetical protein